MVRTINLPLSLTAGQWPSSAIHLALALGEVVEPPQPEEIAVSSIFAAGYQSSATASQAYGAKGKSASVAALRGFDFGVGITMVNDYAVSGTSLPHVATNDRVSNTKPDSIKSCASVTNKPLGRLIAYDDVVYTPAKRIKACSSAGVKPAKLLLSNGEINVLPAKKLKSCAEIKTSASQLLTDFENVNYQRGVRPACEWIDIPIPEPPKPFDPNPCGVRPSSLKLPLALSRKEQTNALMLPLPLACDYKTTIPLLSTYMIYNEITATLDNQPIDLIAPSVSTSMDAFCWQFSGEITYDDFVQFNIKDRTDNPVLTLTINNLRWDLQIEAYDDSQAFISNRASISGRSQTAQLGGSAVMRTPALLLQSLNARQIIDKQLEFLPFTLADYDATDWLVPAGTYTQYGSPMDTILDVATAGGNFVESHRFNKTLKVKKRWPVAAWQIKDQAPTLNLPADVIMSIDGRKNDNMQYNSIYIMGSGQNSKGGKVYRQASNQTPEASAIKHELYTDVTVLREAGIAELSDSGSHIPYTIKALLSDDYNIRLAEVGEVCEASSPISTIKGVVTGVDVGVEDDNGAQTVYQTIALDVYAGA